MNSKRRNRLEQALAAFEAEYRARLVGALETCASGYWGLFGQNAHLGHAALTAVAHERSGAAELMQLGNEIDSLRQELGNWEPFPLHAKFLQMRGRKSENDLGEARLAEAWLAELSSEK
jgi:uncharacterized protein CbrC (UPF0167 family)